LRRDGAEPLPPGPRGRILCVAPFQGGIGGVERLTRAFARWVEGAGFTATMLFEHADLPPGPYTLSATDHVRVLPERAWGRTIEGETYDFLYVLPAGLTARRWGPRFERVRAKKVLLDLDPKRRLTPAFDVLHCDAPRAGPLPLPHVVATPDPRPDILPGPEVPRQDFLLTVFTPYGRIKGHHRIPALLEGTGRRLVWCHAPVTFSHRDRRRGREILRRIEEVRHPRLEVLDTPSLEDVYRLYRACRGYVCFSEEESMGYAMLDALALGTPLAAARIGICRAIPDFRPTEDFARPVFATYEMPPTIGYEGLFRRLSEAGVG
jgi:hypothetical protein